MVPELIAGSITELEEVAEEAVVGREVVAVAATAELGVDLELRVERPILEAWGRLEPPDRHLHRLWLLQRRRLGQSCCCLGFVVFSPWWFCVFFCARKQGEN